MRILINGEFFVSMLLQERKHKQPHRTQNQINKALNQLICVLYYYYMVGPVLDHTLW